MWLSCLYLTYMAGQVLLVLGVCQGQGAGWQDVAGGFHFIPGFLVQVLQGLQILLLWDNAFWSAPLEQIFLVSGLLRNSLLTPRTSFQIDVYLII